MAWGSRCRGGEEPGAGKRLSLGTAGPDPAPGRHGGGQRLLAAVRPGRPGRESGTGGEGRGGELLRAELGLTVLPVSDLKAGRQRRRMCGRTSCHLPRDALTRACAYRDRRGQPRLPEWRDPDKYRPSYNRSPQSDGPVLLSRLHFEKVTASSASCWLLAANNPRLHPCRSLKVCR